MARTYRVAVVGATGLVGQHMLEVLEERGFPVSEFIPLASARSAGETVEFGGATTTVREATPESFEGVDIVLMSAGRGPSEALAPAAAASGAVVIDNSSMWRMDPEIPLVVPEVNPEDIGLYETRRIIANPNCSTIQMVVALAPLHREAGLRRVIVSTYQAVSGKGRAAMDELGQQVTALFNTQEVTPNVFNKRIAFNCLPHIDDFADGDFTKEELKMRQETRKIMHLPEVKVCATCVRVPVFNGHALSVNAEFDRPISPARAREVLREAKGIMLMDEPERAHYPTQVDVDGSDATFVGRLRVDETVPHGLALWCVADNLRKGAATNAVQIAELLVRDHLK